LEEEKGSSGERTSIRLGILGSGQLALMLAEAAAKLGISTTLFSEDLENDVAREEFFSASDLVIFESDFLPFSSLRNLEFQKYCPELAVIEKLSDKIRQKEILRSLQIPSPHFEVLGKDKKIDLWIEDNYRRFPRGCVFKWSRGGYDGKGVQLSNGKSGEDRDFIVAGLQKNSDIFCEERIEFVRELSQISAFSKTKDWAYYPLVISEQEKGICRNVFGPAKNFGVSELIQVGLQSAAKKLGELLELYGVFAIEAFELKDGGFAVNEIAPRVHNTGHFSLNFSAISQFENHLRAVTGMKLGATESTQNFYMRNVLGDRLAFLESAPKATLPPGWHFKWYNKNEVRRGRKLGHLNFGGFKATELQALRELAAGLELQILNSLR